MVEFDFIVKRYVPYRLRDDYEFGTEGEPVRVKGIKTARLFNSWFRLMSSRKRLIEGTIRFSNHTYHIKF